MSVLDQILLIPGFGASPSPGPLPVTYPLDEVAGAVAAYSTAKLSSTYSGPCIKVRESGGDTTADIGFAADGTLDTVALLAHCGANDGFVETWYDQSGNGIDVTQATDALQPKIVSAGVVEIDDFDNIGVFKDIDDRPTAQLTATAPSAVFDALDMTVFNVRADRWNAANTGQRRWLNVGGGRLICRSQNVNYTSNPAGGSYALSDALAYASADDPRVETIELGATTVKRWVNNWQMQSEARTDTTPGNETSDSIVVMPDNEDQQFHGTVSAILIYPALSDANRQTLEQALATRFSVDYPVSSCDWTLINTILESQRTILNWVDTFAESDFDVDATVTTTSWDGTYQSEEQLFSVWASIETEKDHMLRLANKWFVRDDGAGAGYEGSGTLRWEPFAASGLEMTLANLEDAGGTQRNAVYYADNPELQRRYLVHAMVNLCRYYAYAIDDIAFYSDLHGGVLDKTLRVFASFKDSMPPNVQMAVLDLCRRWMYQLRNYTPRDANTNIDMKTVVAAARFWLLDSRAGSRDVAMQVAKKCMLGKVDAVYDTNYDSDVGAWFPAGYIAEFNGPETTYNGVSIFYTSLVWRLVSAETDWAWFEELLSRMIDWKSHQFFRDPDGYWDGGCGYAARTGDSVVYDQRGGNVREVALAALFTNARPFLQYPSETGGTVVMLPDAASMVSDINADIAAWNASASTDYGTPQAWATDLFADRHWGPDDQAALAAGSWYTPLRGLITGGDSSLQYPWEKTTGLPYYKQFPSDGSAGEEEFTYYMRTDTNGDKWGIFLEHVDRKWPYNSWGGGKPETICFENTGHLLRCGRDQAGRSWADIDTWACFHVWGKDASGTPVCFTTAIAAEQSAPGEMSVASDMTASPPHVTTTTNLHEEDLTLVGTSVNTTVEQKWEMVTDGPKCTLTLTTPNTYAATQCEWTIPVCLRDTGAQSGLSDAVIQYHTGTGWSTMTASEVSAEWIRIGKDYGSGTVYQYINFSTAQTVKLSASVWAASYQSEGRWRNIHVKLHAGTTGSSANLPASKVVVAQFQQIDPGLPVAPELAISYPATSETLPVAHLWAVKWTEVDNGETITGRFLEYSTNYSGDEGAATWTQIASDDGGAGEQITDNGDGTLQYVGVGDNAIPTILAAVRVRDTVSGMSDVSALITVSSVTPTTVVQDDLSATDGDLLDDGYALDTDTVGTGIVAWRTDSYLEITSNKAYPQSRVLWSSQAIVDVNGTNQIVEALFSIGTHTNSNESEVGVTGNASLSNPPVAGFTKAVVDVRNGGSYAKLRAARSQGSSVSTDVIGTVDNDTTEHLIRLQTQDSLYIASLWNAAGTTLHAAVAVWEAPTGSEGAGIIAKDPTSSLDNFKAMVF